MLIREGAETGLPAAGETEGQALGTPATQVHAEAGVPACSGARRKEWTPLEAARHPVGLMKTT